MRESIGRCLPLLLQHSPHSHVHPPSRTLPLTPPCLPFLHAHLRPAPPYPAPPRPRPTLASTGTLTHHQHLRLFYTESLFSLCHFFVPVNKHKTHVSRNSSPSAVPCPGSSSSARTGTRTGTSEDDFLVKKPQRYRDKAAAGVLVGLKLCNLEAALI